MTLLAGEKICPKEGHGSYIGEKCPTCKAEKKASAEETRQ